MAESWLSVTVTTMTMMACVTLTRATDPSSSAPLTTTVRDDLPLDSKRAAIEEALDVIEAASTGSLGEVCVNTAGFKSLPAGVELDPRRYDAARQKADMTAMVLQNFGAAEATRRNALLDALTKSLLVSVNDAVEARVIALNASTGTVIAAVWLKRSPGSVGEPTKVENHALQPGSQPDPSLPWFENAGGSTELRSPKFMQSPPIESYRGWWTIPYFSCKTRRWLISYSVNVKSPDVRPGVREFISMDVDISGLEVNQCDAPPPPLPPPLPPPPPPPPSRDGNDGVEPPASNQIAFFKGTHKCHTDTTQCVYQGPDNRVNENGVGAGWSKGAYACKCRQGFYSVSHQRAGFDGILVEAAWKEMKENRSDSYERVFRCSRCAPGCARCKGPEPCLATYNWPFRITLLAVSIFCAFGTIVLVAYMYQHRKLKVFKVASPIFLSITLLGCALMYLEMAAIFPVLDMYSCIATKWTRHMGFCVSYTALLMKTWRVSLTYRVKSAHKVKLTDKQLLQWMVPILLVMLIYLGTWTLSAPPYAEVIADNHDLKFYQCSYNWWDHSLAIGEILFLAWGIKVCYNVRNAESLFNEARLISYAIYNIAAVNITMIAIHLLIFPHAGPDIKYLLGFLRTQFSTSVTILLVFGPKVIRVLRGQGDQWDSRARARGVTASFSLNGIGLVPEETTDLYQENEELKEEIQKLAARIEFMKIVHMEMHNRHIKPKMGGYFSTHGHGHGHPSTGQSPIAKSSTASFILKQTAVERGATAAAAAAVEDSTFPSGSLHRARRMEMLKERKAERERERNKEKEQKEKSQQEKQQERRSSGEKV
ncbi:probable G-protein coupled receptor CG31760 isoform X1 [Harpegnathos saltator]|uniref:probable G-protein coupled receptor CG31760 isoform X1 n=2 Tax=Harpegnathos saltator TaxID=610380 RepID=UPI000DBED7D8|nr:probable G-protein coupled receptor CG31760 isoform X1 [Harpegnathos saltator]XP_025162470.1 probable G-protein coupled receptor CG31760 isoform X1 [Harpegnathos saltator]XP_025162482.1 probable G-protein coupled receptor CG31760 isoform X1 [Harpegnathos saltator]XP_025162486.1 probable G-protein coupled receptor CG31760 isoform X1 [Harpegnathos saltator]XP_025162500.1 probable G-protein coupled receptor CG31760 isoform X1 [Harpegnathos saltator]XP_025162507.1 probable G-protein coupled rec